MADLIDRQAAIEMISKRLDALKLLHIGTSTFKDGLADGYARIRSDIKFLPSAQPEIVRCKDCKHYDTHDHRCKVWNHGVIVMGFCHKGERR